MSKTDETLLEAIERRDPITAMSLIEQGVDITVASPNGWTPLMLSVLFDLRPLVQLLLEYGADPNQSTSSSENPSRTALLVAINNARVEALELLLQYRVDLDAPVHGEKKALEWARTLNKRSSKQHEMDSIIDLLEGRPESS